MGKQRTAEQMIQDLETKIAAIKARDTRRRARAKPEVRFAIAATKGVPGGADDRRGGDRCRRGRAGGVYGGAAGEEAEERESGLTSAHLRFDGCRGKGMMGASDRHRP